MPDPVLALTQDALARIAQARHAAALDEVQSAFLGRKGRLQEALRGIGALAPAERGPAGQAANRAKQRIEAALESRRRELIEAAEASLAETEWVDATLPPPPASGDARCGGSLHPLTGVVREMEDVLACLGFRALDGPWVEDERHNFTALNIPPDHPARDMQDTYWMSDGNLLRTHTSPVQIRAMEAGPPPIRAVCLGRVFRHEQLDATHENTFHQIEGFYVDRQVSVGHMLYVLRELLRELLREDVEVRVRPSYFPFVEPGFELDARFRGRWMELLGCGMVHPEVLRQGGIDPQAWSGFAFGLGIDRVAMLKHGIEDVRHFMGGDLRFLRQFRGGSRA